MQTEVKTFKREEPIYGPWLEPHDMPVYDTLYFPHSFSWLIEQGKHARRTCAFHVPCGIQIHTNQGFKTKDFTETNLWEEGYLGDSHAMIVTEITAGFVKDLAIVPVSSPWYHGTFLEFFINQRLYYQAHASQLAEPAALFADDKERKRMMEFGFNLLRRPLGAPLVISLKESFQVRVEVDKLIDLENCGMAGGGPDKLVIYLHGRHFRAIF